VRSSDIAARCRELALRVDASGEWGELGDTLREAAAEVERLRLEPSVQEEIVAWSVDLHDAREEIKRLTAEVERLRLRENEIVATKIAMSWLPPQSCVSAVLLELMLKRLGGRE